MSSEAYKQKAEAKLEEQKAAIDSAKARLKGMNADARLEAEKQLSGIERAYEGAKVKMAEIADAGEEAWDEFTKGLENTWGSVTDSVKKLLR
jgi:hypothetical protein